MIVPARAIKLSFGQTAQPYQDVIIAATRLTAPAKRRAVDRRGA
jgi:hypothetical protein